MEPNIFVYTGNTTCSYGSYRTDNEKNPSYEHNFPSYIRLSDTYITEDGASISKLSEERVLCRWERVIIRL